MGWTTTYKPSYITTREFLVDRFTDDGEKHCWKVLDVAIKNRRTAYMAIERTSKQTGQRIVFAVVCLLQYWPKASYENFGFKDMDESMGPCERDCPERILKLLTPTDSKFAQQWREACWENIRRRKAIRGLKVGDLVEFEEPVLFTDGSRRSWGVVTRSTANSITINSFYRVKRMAAIEHGIRRMDLPTVDVSAVQKLRVRERGWSHCSIKGTILIVDGKDHPKYRVVWDDCDRSFTSICTEVSERIRGAWPENETKTTDRSSRELFGGQRQLVMF